MAVTDLNVLSALKSKMRWHQTRQRVLAENVANADTPGYRAKDLRSLKFKNTLAAVNVAGAAGRAPVVRATKTSAMHIDSPFVRPTGGNLEVGKPDFDITPQGNSVVLEDQMIKLADNQMEYEAAANLYRRGLSMLKTAISRR